VAEILIKQAQRKILSVSLQSNFEVECMVERSRSQRLATEGHWE